MQNYEFPVKNVLVEIIFYFLQKRYLSMIAFLWFMHIVLNKEVGCRKRGITFSSLSIVTVTAGSWVQQRQIGLGQCTPDNLAYDHVLQRFQ